MYTDRQIDRYIDRQIDTQIDRQIFSAANKGRSTVNYRQSLAFDQPYLCYDHCDRWLFQEIFFLIIIFKSSRTQMLFKTGLTRNFAIFTGKDLCWSLFLIIFQPRRKREFNSGDSCENCKNFSYSFHAFIDKPTENKNLSKVKHCSNGYTF